jgi:hypothetical protein
LASLANLQAQLASAATNSNLVDRARQVQNIRSQIADQQRNAISVKDQNINMHFQAADEFVVRLRQPAAKFDDKGNPQTYTPQELRAMRSGSGKYQGYHGEFDDLRPGQVVTVFVPQQKTKPKPPPRKPKPAEADGKQTVEPEKYPISMVYVHGERR